jgi:UDP-3-O-[3-hydroxymyristoyl] N-acetylglucosamine deacetylase
VIAERAGHAMHTALVQRLLRDRSAWDLAHGYDETPEPAQEQEDAGMLRATLPAHA